MTPKKRMRLGKADKEGAIKRLRCAEELVKMQPWTHVSRQAVAVATAVLKDHFPKFTDKEWKEGTVRAWAKEAYPLEEFAGRSTRSGKCAPAPPPRKTRPRDVDDRAAEFWRNQRLRKLRKVVQPEHMKLQDANAATVRYVLRLANLASTVAFDDVYTLHLRGIALDAESMGLVLTLLSRKQQIFAVNLGEQGNRTEESFWIPFVEAIERGENGVVFSFADTANSNVTHKYAKRLKDALRKNRLRLENTRDCGAAPWRSQAFRNALVADCPKGSSLDMAFGKPFFGATLRVWE